MFKLSTARVWGFATASALFMALAVPAQAVYWDLESEVSGFFISPDGSLDSGNGDVAVERGLGWEDDFVGSVGLRWTPGLAWLPGIGYRLTELYAQSEYRTPATFNLLGVEAQGGSSSLASIYEGVQADLFLFYPFEAGGFNLQAGAGMRLLSADFQLLELGAQRDATGEPQLQFASSELSKVIATANLWAQRDLTPRLRVGAALSGTPERANTSLDAELWGQYEVYKNIFARAGYRSVKFDISDEPGLVYDLEFDGAFISLVAHMGNGVVPLPPDTDGDGVRDPEDRCNETPAGAPVNRFGCRSDLDGDGVFDGDDACPDTPQGALVDDSGCLLDGDADGVPDGLDICPETAPGLAVDNTGCALDEDGDGVPDSLDLCPNTPAGTVVSEDGCSNDADSDGVINAADRCPNTPLGVAVDQFGCNADRDGDGVIFARDACLDTPLGTPVDETGCPLGDDEDNDGVLDVADDCPGTLPGFEVDATGCVVISDTQSEVTLPGVNFELGSATLTQNAKTLLNQVVEALSNQVSLLVEVQGHTDSQGSEALNQALSERRAQSVVRYLVAQGIEANRLRAAGYGELRPVADNTTKSGRARNRRVVLKVLGSL
ncbi:OmpA family protein [bacterium]|nr:OmpA family protein [bacterium]